MWGDPVGELQPLLVAHLQSLEPKSAIEVNAPVAPSAGWSPHVLQRKPDVGWYIHPLAPESDRWAKRVSDAQAVVPTLKIGIVTTAEALTDDEFLIECHRLQASLIVVERRGLKFQIDESYHSVSDYIYEARIELAHKVVRDLLDQSLERALAEQDSLKKGVLLETLCAVLMSQVDGFIVKSVGISNRSQQMDVFIHNRNAEGALSNSPIVLVEAKNWKSKKVSPTEYAELERKLKSRHGRANLGFLITTGRFTRGVGDERRRDSFGSRMIALVDGNRLPRLWRGRETITATIEDLVLESAVGD